MRTDLECMACFIGQALSAARLSTDDPELHQQAVRKAGGLLSGLDLSLSPPENAVRVYALVAELTGAPDPFSRIKKESNELALRLRGKARERIEKSENSLLAAVRYAIGGNIIDYGIQQEFDAMHVLAGCLDREAAIDDFRLFEREVAGARGLKILYLADNCGEIVFDGLLAEQLAQRGHDVTMVVRGARILNDAAMEDAVATGVDKICRIMANGSPCPGTVLGSCSAELREAFGAADLIISKGQGNFETLSEVDAPIYFLLTVKCGVVARHIATLKDDAMNTITGSGEFVLLKREVRNACTED